ncbi:MAG: rhomboid family intramembrane serine protease [Bacteroidota bacterium]
MSITLLIVIITVLVSYQAMENPVMKASLFFRPYDVAKQKEYYRALTSGFIHRDWLHLGVNMYVLYIFGEYVESQFVYLFGTLKGRLFFLLVYLATIVFAHTTSFLKHRNNPGYASLGASGGVSGVLFIYVLFAPWSMLLLFFIIPMPAIIAAVGYLIYSSWASRNANDNIGHDAHIDGALFGFWFAILLKPSLFSQFLDELVRGFPF